MNGGLLPNTSKMVFGFFLSTALTVGFAADGSKPAGAVSAAAINTEADGHCAKAKADCPKGSEANCPKEHAKGAGHHAKGEAAKGEAASAQITTGEGADCPKGKECPKGHCPKHKVGEAKAPPAGNSGTPAAKPADADKASSHPG